ncbi:MAG: carbamoyltransferase HypF [Fidelibacterota bacterium]
MERWQIKINGIVQGVGFRPFVYKLAQKCNLAGFVTNTTSGVEIEVEGTVNHLREFQRKIPLESPPLSVIRDLKFSLIPLNGESNFQIIPSKNADVTETMVSPDVAVCPDCLIELFNPMDRRYRYPFINCTNCGPRYTIIKDIPYDRPATSMQPFKMCTQCQAEYDDPENRRFHAQPNACPNCGPAISLWVSEDKPISTDDKISAVANLLKNGAIIAIKGLGGFHLAVDARNGVAIQQLRRRKHREEKPLAIMVKDLETVRQLCYVNEQEEHLLNSFQSPIVLLRKREDETVAEAVAPGNDRFGVMLPYTPLHHLLLHDAGFPLVMTSGNLSEEPIAISNQEAFERLAGIADYFLIHNRDIYLRSDDSVMIVLENHSRTLRRSRGFVPKPVFVKSKGSSLLAVGGELKNTICLLKNDQAIVSQHIGDLENLLAYNFFIQTINHLERLFQVEPELIVHDLHPDYLATKWAREQNDSTLLGVQHHHAHLAAVMAENQVDQPVIGLIMDGTGYGIDGTVWGGEVLVGDYHQYHRFAHFETMPLPGGEAAIKEPWRIAVSYLFNTFGKVPQLPFLEGREADSIVEILQKKINCPQTSSCGRLFDAVAAICGAKPVIRYEAQTAIEWMQWVENLEVRPLAYQLEQQGEKWVMLIKPIIRAVVRALNNGEDVCRISSRFHLTLIKMFMEVVHLASQETGINSVVLSGGVFQNRVLFSGLLPRLEVAGYQVYTHKQVPTNDGGISLGQAMIGRHYLAGQA